mgnify:CR=1 FL=1
MVLRQLFRTKRMISLILNNHLNGTDNNGQTVLHRAAINGQVDELSLLLTLPGTDVTCIAKDGCTALSIAVSQGHAECVRFLQEKSEQNSFVEILRHIKN